jgi:hypothetical protein
MVRERSWITVRGFKPKFSRHLDYFSEARRVSGNRGGRATPKSVQVNSANARHGKHVVCMFRRWVTTEELQENACVTFKGDEQIVPVSSLGETISCIFLGSPAAAQSIFIPVFDSSIIVISNVEVRFTRRSITASAPCLVAYFEADGIGPKICTKDSEGPLHHLGTDFATSLPLKTFLALI